MTSSRWEHVQGLFLAASALEPEAQAAYLAEACAADPTLRDEVLALLRADRSSSDSGFISDVVAEAGADLAREAESRRIGERVGPYRLIREIGHGGMGTVYLAERVDEQYQASVAIKFVRGALAAPELARRLRAERQILSDLTHPNIAWLLDGGTAADGTPYLVMEYVDGEAIDRWCDRRGIGLTGRLSLFQQVAEAVQHAHQALIVHRDLKPSNILVTGDGTPKLVDFGIAKLLRDEAPDATATLRVMTPAYAAPEQVRGQRITVATDVYALGGVLYRLLSGRRPVEITGASPGEMERRICEVMPPPPSVVAEGPAAAWKRNLRGDLDTIVLKALRKEPERRYASVEQLADDIRRHQVGRPVRARADSWRYRAGKFVRRNRIAVGAAALVGMTLLGGLGATLWQAQRANRARTAAETALAQSDEVKNFLLSLFRANDPDEARGAQITVRELLDRGMRRVDSLAGQPAVQADLLETLADVEMSLGEYARAQGMYDREVAIRRAHPGGADSLLAQALIGRGIALDRRGVPDSAAAAFREVLHLSRGNGRAEGPLAMTALFNLGDEYARMGRDRAADSALGLVVAIQQRTLAPDAPARMQPLSDLGLQLAVEGRYAEAIPLLREALRIALASDPDTASPVTADPMDNLGMALRESGQYDAAEPLVRRELALRVKTQGPRHRFTADAYFSLGLLLALRGHGNDFVESDSLLHAALDVFRATLGPKHRAVGYALYALGVLALHRGDFSQAERWFRQALVIRRTTTQDSPRETVRTLLWLGETELARGGRADATMREADSLAAATLAADDPVRARTDLGLAIAMAHAGAVRDAEPRFRDGVSRLATRVGALHPFVLGACQAGRDVGLDGGSACARADSALAAAPRGPASPRRLW